MLDGAKALAIPTRFGQNLEIKSIENPIIQWESFEEKNNCWFECEIETQTLKLISSTFYSEVENPQENTAEMLQLILKEAKKLNPSFLTEYNGFKISTKLSFPRNWGLGSSSTLINNIANWAKVDAYQLLKNTFGGSGYDIACAQKNSPILYQLINEESKIETVQFNPIFKNQLYFIHLNRKQDSRKGIEQYRKNKKNISTEIAEISRISKEILKTTTIEDFEKLIVQHEQIISKIIQQKPIQELLFPDYFGKIKSLGAWGGDFILVTGNEKTPQYFAQKGYQTIIKFEDMILHPFS